MRYRRTLPVALAAGFLLGSAAPAAANAIAPSAFFWPGVLPLTWGMAVTASILAALLERPFLAGSGLKHPLCDALQANFLSLIVGFLTLPIGVGLLYLIGPLWSLMAMGMSILIEGAYLRRLAKEDGGNLLWSSITWANALSSFVLILISLVAIEIADANRTWPWQVRPHVDWLYWSSTIVSLAVFAGSFLLPAIARRIERMRAGLAHPIEASADGCPGVGAAPLAEGEPILDAAAPRAPP